MVTTIGILAALTAAALGTYLIYRLNEPAVRSTVAAVEKARYVLGFLFLILAAYHLLRSGNIVYVVIAILGFGFVVAYVLVERPFQSTI